MPFINILVINIVIQTTNIQNSEIEMNNYSSLYIFYISGTGNARASSGWIAEEAVKRGIKTVVQQIDRLENINMPSTEENLLIGFAFPTHGFNSAQVHSRIPARTLQECLLVKHQGWHETLQIIYARIERCSTSASVIYSEAQRIQMYRIQTS
jgi:hypothetical protein